MGLLKPLRRETYGVGALPLSYKSLSCGCWRFADLGGNYSSIAVYESGERTWGKSVVTEMASVFYSDVTL